MKADTQKTTVYLDRSDYRRLKGIASRRGQPPASLVREAVAEYVVRSQASPRPSFIGIGNGPNDLAANDEAYLAGFGEASLSSAPPVSAKRRPRRR